MDKPFIIAGNEILPGTEISLKLPVSRLPSGNQINIHAHIYRSDKPGPVLLLLAGMHGDEINGIEIVRRSIESGLFSELNRGSVIAIPLLNVYGFINFSRDAVNGKDVNRSFPGSASGSMASRVASVLTRHILPYVDYGLDFHTGGQSRFNLPQVRYSPKDLRSSDLAKAFNALVRIEKPTIPKSFRRSCLDAGIPAIVFEGGEALRLDEFSVSEGIRGIKRILHHLEMKSYPIPGNISVNIKKSAWKRASTAGVFTALRVAGDQVRAGEVIGTIKDPYGFNQLSIKSSHTGIIICHNNHPVVYPGDPLFNIGFEISRD
jgi:predicted deacylase